MESWDARLATIQKVISESTDEKRILELQKVYDTTLAASKDSIPLDFVIDKMFWHYLVGLVVTFFSSILLRK